MLSRAHRYFPHSKLIILSLIKAVSFLCTRFAVSDVYDQLISGRSPEREHKSARATCPIPRISRIARKYRSINRENISENNAVGTNCAIKESGQQGMQRLLRGGKADILGPTLLNHIKGPNCTSPFISVPFYSYASAASTAPATQVCSCN